MQSEPPAPFAGGGTAQRLRSRTPAPKKPAAAEVAAASSSTAAADEPSGKSRKQEVGASASKKPLKIPSKMKNADVAKELAELVDHGGWNPADAARLKVLNKKAETADPSEARNMSIEMQLIYKRNYNNLKKAH
jgi:hypothetical protein